MESCNDCSTSGMLVEEVVNCVIAWPQSYIWFCRLNPCIKGSPNIDISQLIEDHHCYFRKKPTFRRELCCWIRWYREWMKNRRLILNCFRLPITFLPPTPTLWKMYFKRWRVSNINTITYFLFSIMFSGNRLLMIFLEFRWCKQTCFCCKISCISRDSKKFL